MTQTQTKEVAKKATNAVVNKEALETSWGTEDVASKDLLISKILIAQGLSKAVSEEKCQMGDIYDSVTLEKLGSARESDTQPVKIIPLSTFKTWVCHESVNGKREFKHVEPVTPANAARPRQYTDNAGIAWDNDEAINFYVMLESEMDDPAAIPRTITFKRTSYKAGRVLATHFSKCQLAAQRGHAVPPAATTFALGGVKTQNDLGTFYVANVEVVGKTKPEHVGIAFDWYKTLQAGKHQVDESENGVAAEASNTVHDEKMKEF